MSDFTSEVYLMGKSSFLDLVTMNRIAPPDNYKRPLEIYEKEQFAREH